MLRKTVLEALQIAVQRLTENGVFSPETLTELPVLDVQPPKNAEHGDFACNFALQAARFAGTNPRALAEQFVAQLQDSPVFSKIEIAGPGFINLTLAPNALAAGLQPALTKGNTFAHLTQSHPRRINVEFVSVNPNGPITIGSGRGAAYGSTLCNILAAAGHQVHREYYINDGVNSEQMRLFAESVRALALNLPFPENGYKGDYVQGVADRIEKRADADITWWQSEAQTLMLAKQKEDLSAFGVHFETWFSEQSLHDSGTVAAAVEALTKTGIADTEPVRNKWVTEGDDRTLVTEPQPLEPGTKPPLWLRSTLLGDDQDRVLRRGDGRLTYIASDVAYHQDKLNRPANATNLITILGPDHHGYIGRLRAVMAAFLLEGDAHDRGACDIALQKATDLLLVQIYQLVRFLKDGKPAPMRKRDGNIYAIIDLIHEIGQAAAPQGTQAEQDRIGRDVARFFYLMRHHDTTFDFDLDLAARQSDENPVFYVQYAHARICSVLDRAAVEMPGLTPALTGMDALHPAERALLLKALDLPAEIERTAADYAVNRIATYTVELARLYHTFYDNCRVIEPADPATSSRRVAVCQVARTALRSALDLLGVSAPERMERAPLSE